MQVAFWYDGSKEHKKLYKELSRKANKMCLECNKPLTRYSYLCQNCIGKLKISGLEQTHVYYTDVGISTINYQQYLHTRFFNCNARYEYRGLKQDRVKLTIDQSIIDKSSQIISNYLTNITKDERLIELYSKVKHLKNTDRRLLYSITLYAISYFILNNNQFKTLAHFQASIIREFENTLIRIYYKQYKTKPTSRSNTIHTNFIDLVARYNTLIRAVEPVLCCLSKNW